MIPPRQIQGRRGPSRVSPRRRQGLLAWRSNSSYSSPPNAMIDSPRAEVGGMNIGTLTSATSFRPSGCTASFSGVSRIGFHVVYTADRSDRRRPRPSAAPPRRPASPSPASSPSGAPPPNGRRPRSGWRHSRRSPPRATGTRPPGGTGPVSLRHRHRTGTTHIRYWRTPPPRRSASLARNSKPSLSFHCQ